MFTLSPTERPVKWREKVLLVAPLKGSDSLCLVIGGPTENQAVIYKVMKTPEKAQGESAEPRSSHSNR